MSDPMNPLVIRVSNYAGFCWGVQRALDMAQKAVAEAPIPINTLGPLIHNPQVVSELERSGVGVICHPHEAKAGTVILRSHGVPKGVREQLCATGLEVRDATCPFVTSAQEKAVSLRSQGYFVVILGEKNHPEVSALLSYAGEDSLVVETPEDLPDILPSQRIGLVVQSTQSQDRLARLISSLTSRVRELLVFNTICSATQQRQSAAIAMAGDVDLVIVVGGRNSGNTHRLAEVCGAVQPRTYHIESAAEIDPLWLQDVRVVGVTAGASTAPSQIEAIVSRLRELDP